MFPKGKKVIFLYSDDEPDMLGRIEKFVVMSLLREDFKNLFGGRRGEVCFRTPQVYVTFNQKTEKIATEHTPLSAVPRLPTVLILPGGLLMAKRDRGWRLYDPRSHQYLPGVYLGKPIIYPKLRLPVFFLERDGKSILMNGFTGKQYYVNGRMKVVSPVHLLLTSGARRWLYDLSTMSSLKVGEYMKLTPRFDSVESGEKKYLLDTEVGELYEFDDITVSSERVSRYLLVRGGEIIGYVEGTLFNRAHPPRSKARH